ncbi:MAG: pinensin family lanthipeptide [Bacteroidetes bacterium]|nr:pinensin family lanthipeptide [Bacteroidota bacterium]
MKTTKKLSLGEIKVESFVTSLKANERETINGGEAKPMVAQYASALVGTLTAVPTAQPATPGLGASCAVANLVEANDAWTVGERASDLLCGNSRNFYCESVLNGCGSIQAILCISAAVNC